MLHEHPEGLLQVALVRDQHPVQTFGTRGPDEPFRHTVRLRRTNRRTKNLQTVAAKHVVERGREFLVAIPDQEPEPFRTRRERPGELASPLGHPGCVRVRRTAGYVYAAAAQLDEEEHVQPLQPDRVHREEVDGEQALSMRSYEFAPRHPPTTTCWSETCLP